jgi:hypothetical protein
VVLDVADVALQRRLVHVHDIEVLIQQLIHGGASAWVPLLVNLVQEPGPESLGLSVRSWTGWHDLAQVVPLPGKRVDAGVDADPQ